ncbi:hypothetical protein RB653_006049 [Dictyostelium firmibasis]|uniref:Uncharacterized protein n=1 Tax=Dictyostelium firmibasis TaxID=79012 RepID=A0AAN7U8C0_9MYCE
MVVCQNYFCNAPFSYGFKILFLLTNYKTFILNTLEFFFTISNNKNYF